MPSEWPTRQSTWGKERRRRDGLELADPVNIGATSSIAEREFATLPPMEVVKHAWQTKEAPCSSSLSLRRVSSFASSAEGRF